MLELNEYEKKRLKELRELTQMVDAKPLIERMFDKSGELSDEQRRVFQDSVMRSFEIGGNVAIERAFLEGVLTEEEWVRIRDELRIPVSDFGIVLTAVMNSKTPEGDETVIATIKTSPIFMNKDFLIKRFGVSIMCAEEIEILIKNEMKNEVKDVPE
jgi:hypothetical protein